MGSSYSNITLHGPDRARIIQAVRDRGRRAFVGPEVNGCVVVFDEDSDTDAGLAADVACKLTGDLDGVALAATVYDEDVLFLSLARGGEVIDQYISRPGYYQGDDTPPEGGN